MRRRRQTLQVSTFPFLAVLLCAMGSLILLLLVIDRRAHLFEEESRVGGARHGARTSAFCWDAEARAAPRSATPRRSSMRRPETASLCRSVGQPVANTC